MIHPQKDCRAFLVSDDADCEGDCGFCCDLPFGHDGDHIAIRDAATSDHPLTRKKWIHVVAEVRWREKVPAVTA